MQNIDAVLHQSEQIIVQRRILEQDFIKEEKNDGGL